MIRMDTQAPISPALPTTRTDPVRDYHVRTAHRFEGFARGPDALDWDAQPAPFRHYSGCDTVDLPRIDQIPGKSEALHTALACPFDQLEAAVPAQGLTLEAIGVLLQLSFGLTAWKSFGPDRWALRANPSSGNLHPVEAWLICQGVPGLVDGVHHYRPERHALSLRAADPFNSAARSPRIAVALSSVMWREAWKYGERAFRYCQLDVGHAMGALRYAAAVLGWSLDEQRHIGHDTLAARLGLDREADFPARRNASTEREEAEVLLTVGCGAPADTADAMHMRTAAVAAEWHGTASTIDPYPMYRWPVIADVARQTRRTDTLPARAQRPALRCLACHATGGSAHPVGGTRRRTTGALRCAGGPGNGGSGADDPSGGGAHARRVPARPPPGFDAARRHGPQLSERRRARPGARTAPDGAASGRSGRAQTTRPQPPLPSGHRGLFLPHDRDGGAAGCRRVR
jgi:SagB-type dehydrogenase family enzyme